MSNRAELSRRSFLRVMGGVGASFALGSFATISCATMPDEGHKTAAKGKKKKQGPSFSPSAFIQIDPDGMVTVVVSRSDMGQGVRTAFAVLVAEELDADWDSVTVIQAVADPKTFGGQGTGGSSSITSMNGKLRELGAAARSMLIAAAAKQWGVDPSTCTTAHGKVVHAASGRYIGYGDLTAPAALQTVPGSGIKLKDPSEFKIVGKGVSRVDNADVVTGKAIYGLDARVPGMLVAVIARPPAIGAKLQTVVDTQARAVPGVVDVIRFNGGVAVLGKNTWAAISGRDALKLEWDRGENAALNSAGIRAKLKDATIDHLAMPEGAKVVEATFDLPFLAHATMEPMNAIADVKSDSCTIWAPTQVPDSVLRMVTRTLGLPQEKVTVHTTLLGGGFGRRLQTDFISEAVQLSKQVGKPVQVVWTREDDMTNDMYRPACYHTLKGAVAEGKPAGWSHQAIQAGWGNAKGFGDADLVYEIPKAGLRFTGVSTPVPTGPWRSVEHSLLHVVNECFFDELAHAAGKDPYAFRHENLKDDRVRNVLELAAKYSGWGDKLPAGHGRGIACFSGYGSCIAHVVELSVSGQKIKLHRVVAVVDCGLAINPKGVEAQVQGGCVDGLSTALRAAITIEKGGVVQTSWPTYRWMTMDAMPNIEVHVVSGGDQPGGMGEVGYPSVPAAVANAIFSATGKRVRKFPISLSELV